MLWNAICSYLVWAQNGPGINCSWSFVILSQLWMNKNIFQLVTVRSRCSEHQTEGEFHFTQQQMVLCECCSEHLVWWHLRPWPRSSYILQKKRRKPEIQGLPKKPGYSWWGKHNQLQASRQLSHRPHRLKQAWLILNGLIWNDGRNKCPLNKRAGSFEPFLFTWNPWKVMVLSGCGAALSCTEQVH